MTIQSTALLGTSTGRHAGLFFPNSAFQPLFDWCMKDTSDPSRDKRSERNNRFVFVNRLVNERFTCATDKREWKELCIEDLDLTDFPLWLAVMFLDKVDRIVIGKNLAQLPDDVITGARFLQHLDARGACIDAVSPMIFSRTHCHIDLSQNHISEFPVAALHGKHPIINLSSNRIRTVPASIMDANVRPLILLEDNPLDFDSYLAHTIHLGRKDARCLFDVIERPSVLDKTHRHALHQGYLMGFARACSDSSIRTIEAVRHISDNWLSCVNDSRAQPFIAFMRASLVLKKQIDCPDRRPVIAYLGNVISESEVDAEFWGNIMAIAADTSSSDVAQICWTLREMDRLARENATIRDTRSSDKRLECVKNLFNAGLLRYREQELEKRIPGAIAPESTEESPPKKQGEAITKLMYIRAVAKDLRIAQPICPKGKKSEHIPTPLEARQIVDDIQAGEAVGICGLLRTWRPWTDMLRHVFSDLYLKISEPSLVRAILILPGRQPESGPARKSGLLDQLRKNRALYDDLAPWLTSLITAVWMSENTRHDRSVGLRFCDGADLGEIERLVGQEIAHLDKQLAAKLV